MPLILEESESNLTPADLKQFEYENNVSLPEDFVTFYLNNNGGYLLESDDSNPFLLGGFLHIKYGRVPAEKHYHDLIEGFPELRGLIPFAYDDGGNLFLISTNLKDYGQVMVWLMDEKELDIVSGSFTSFIEELT
ncbi:SMI1/KNR4 family protein [Rouxiella sp. Mn2063]|uniref:SMI1/KNR4 family protein n=1 Tax=Rouxiella sp. Mn2063 TaxID=3395262 RepID=UPI003BD035F0